MMLTRLKSTMYQHHRQTVKAVVYNLKNGNSISYSSSNTKTAAMSKSGVLDARYSGRVTVAARHTYASGRYLQASAVVNIKPIRITLKPSTKLITKDTIKTVNGKRSMVISYHSVVNLKASVFTLPSAGVKWSVSDKKRVASVKKNGNTLVITGSSSGNGSVRVIAAFKNIKETMTIKLQGRTETIAIPNPPATGGSGQKDNSMLTTYFKQNPYLSEREKDIIRSMADLSTGNGGESKGPIEKALAWLVDIFVCEALSYPVKVTVNMLNFTGNLVEGVGAALAYIAGGGKSEKLYNQAMKALEQLPSNASDVAWNAVEMLLSIGIAKLGTAAFNKLVAGLKKSLKKKFPKLVGKINDFVKKFKKRGKLIGSLDKLTEDERRMVEELLSQGKNVEIIPRSNIQGDKTPDFKVNGIETELKTLNGKSMNTPVSKIQKAFKQGASTVIIDGRKTGISVKEAKIILERMKGIYKGKIPGKIEIWTVDGVVYGGK